MARHGKNKQEIYDYVLEQYPKDDYEYSIAYSLDASVLINAYQSLIREFQEKL